MRKVACVIITGFLFFSGRVYSSGHDNLKSFGLRNNLLPKDSTSKSTDTSSDDDDIKYRKFAFGLEASSDQSHYGLHDNTAKIPYLEPSFTYTAKSGFYIELSDQYVLIKKNGGFDAFGINPGWDIDLSENTTLNFNYQHYTFSGHSSQLIRSSLSNALEGYITHDIGNLEGKLTIDYDIYKKDSSKSQKSTPNDFIFTPDLSYDFEWDIGTRSSLTVSPEASLDLGTKNFYTQYLNSKANDSLSKGYKIKKKDYSSTTNSSFGALDYNLILTIEYKVGRFKFEPAFTYSYPLYNPSNLPNPPSAYGSITVMYTIKSKK
jgi:hypothetical protein